MKFKLGDVVLFDTPFKPSTYMKRGVVKSIIQSNNDVFYMVTNSSKPITESSIPLLLIHENNLISFVKNRDKEVPLTKCYINVYTYDGEVSAGVYNTIESANWASDHRKYDFIKTVEVEY